MLANPPLVDDVRRTLLDAPEFLAELGISPRDIYAIVYGGAPPPRTPEYEARVRESRVKHVGQGHYAHVFALPSGMVLKVTYDEDDAQAAELIRTSIRRGEPTPGLPRVERVKRLPTRTRERGWLEEPSDQWLYAIVVEPLTPLVSSGTWGLKSWLQWRVKEGLWRTADALARSSEYRAFAVAQVPPVASDHVFAAEIDEGLQGVRWLRERGFHVLDLHVGNFGKTRDGRTVLLDFGHWSKQPSRKRVPMRMAKNSAARVEVRAKAVPMPKVHASFDRHFDEAERAFHDLGTIELHEDEAAGSDNGAGSERQFGYCADEKPIVIAFAPKAEELPRAYIDGLMAHEFGHAIEFRYGRKHLEKLWGRLPESIERRADKIAEHTFGRSIEYGNLDIQCIGCGGKKVRPRRLG